MTTQKARIALSVILGGALIASCSSTEEETAAPQPPTAERVTTTDAASSEVEENVDDNESTYDTADSMGVDGYGDGGGYSSGYYGGDMANLSSYSAISDVCPDPIVVQTDWFPEAEHGALYNLIGDGYTVDTAMKTVRGPLSLGGVNFGLDFEVRTGGPAIGWAPVSTYMYTDDSITLGYANTESQIAAIEDAPLLSVVAPLEINPQMIMWDPETYPEVETLADLKTYDVPVNLFAGNVFPEIFVDLGIWNAGQIDPSYDGSPARFIAEQGAIAQQGFATQEPYNYLYEFEEWGKPVAFEMTHDAGFPIYAATLAIRPDDKMMLDSCLKHLVPLLQHSVVDYAYYPETANAIIIDAVEKYNDSWTQTPEIAAWSVEQQVELGIIGNGPDDTVGNFDMSRVQVILDLMNSELTPADIVTNEYIDPTIKVDPTWWDNDNN